MTRDDAVTRRQALQMGAGLAMPALLPGAAFAQASDFPSRDIKCIAAFPAGSGSDIMTRFFADGMKAFLPRTIIVENKVGASGNLATTYVARSAPDGYTIFIYSASSVAANMSLFKDPGIDAAATIECLASVSKLAFTVSVAKDSPYRRLPELMEAVRKKGDKASYATTAPNGQVAGALLKDILGLRVVEVPYRTAADSLNDLASGNIDYAMYDPTFALAQERAGRVRIIATASKERMKCMPTVPTLHEEGVKDVDCVSWQGLMVPRGVPEPIKQKLIEAFNQMARTKKTEEFLQQAGADPFNLPPGGAQKLFLEEIDNWRRYVKIAKIEPKG